MTALSKIYDGIYVFLRGEFTDKKTAFKRFAP